MHHSCMWESESFKFFDVHQGIYPSFTSSTVIKRYPTSINWMKAWLKPFEDVKQLWVTMIHPEEMQLKTLHSDSQQTEEISNWPSFEESKPKN